MASKNNCHHQNRTDFSKELMMIENKQYNFSAMYNKCQVYDFDFTYLFLRIPNNKQHGYKNKAVYKLLKCQSNMDAYVFIGSVDSKGQLMINKCESISKKNGKAVPVIFYKDLTSVRYNKIVNLG